MIGGGSVRTRLCTARRILKASGKMLDVGARTFRSPQTALSVALIAARATCVVVGPGGRRTVPVESIPTGPGQTSLAPGEFIPLLEHSNLITEVDRYIWEKTCNYLHDWNAMGLTLPVSVNISRMDLYETDLPEYFTELVRRYDLQPAQLRLEITESACMDKADQLISMVNRFRAAGFTVEIDDFGSGYSSLNTLKDVHADILKLDMQFLAGNDNTPRSRQILSFVINMAHALSMEVIAEGVETQEQSDVLQAMGCRYMQGYFYGRPMPAGAFEQLMEAALKKTDTKR